MWAIHQPDLATLVTELLAVHAALIVVRAMSGPAHADIEVHIGLAGQTTR